jgi:hypothetical protein
MGADFARAIYQFMSLPDFVIFKKLLPDINSNSAASSVTSTPKRSRKQEKKLKTNGLQTTKKKSTMVSLGKLGNAEKDIDEQDDQNSASTSSSDDDG